MSVRTFVELPQDELSLGRTARTASVALLAVGLAGGLLAAGLAAATPDGWTRLLWSYLASFVFFLSLGLGALFFVLVQHATRAGWSVVVRRLAESVAPSLLFPMAPLAVPILLGLSRIYPWTDAAAVAADPLMRAKAAWLNVPFFTVRTGVYFAVWGGLSVWFLRRSVAQDRSGEPRITQHLETASTAGLVLFALSTTFFAFDYLMSLTPHWASTIFGVYFFAGCALAFFALLTVVVLAVQGTGRLRTLVSAEHYHDMGKLVFAFIVFWAYIGFSQYMLMWYANLPEETIWYRARQTGSWTRWSLFLLFGHFLVPFLALMSRAVKRRRALIAAGAGWMLLMQWVDVYWLVMPARSPGVVPLSLMDAATFLGIGGLFFASVARRLGAASLVPVRDPRLSESLSFENF